MRVLGMGAKPLLGLALAVACFGHSDFMPCVDVREYGAVGDGLIDDSSAIQRALDSAGSAGGCVAFTNGTFASNDISLRSNISIMISSDAILSSIPGITTKALLHGVGVHDIEIFGGGTVFGRASEYIDYFDPLYERIAPLEIPRPKMVLMQNSSNIHVHDLLIRNGSFWHVHFQVCLSGVVQ